MTLTNKSGSRLGDFMETTKDDIPAVTSVAFRQEGENRRQITELHLHIPLEEVLVKPPTPPTVHHLPHVIRPRLPQQIKSQQPTRPYRPPPPLLRLGRPSPSPPSPPPPPRPSATSTSSSQLRDSVFCSDSGSESSEVGDREDEREEEKEDEGEEEEKEEGISSQGARCKEYREKSKLKRKAGEEDLSVETERNEKLTKIYNRQKYAIAKLKDYYLKKLSKREFKCARQSESPAPTSTSRPLVTIKTEIDMEHIKLETKEEIEEN